jgi:hypothetical protein
MSKARKKHLKKIENGDLWSINQYSSDSPHIVLRRDYTGFYQLQHTRKGSWDVYYLKGQKEGTFLFTMRTLPTYIKKYLIMRKLNETA